MNLDNTYNKTIDIRVYSQDKIVVLQFSNVACRIGSLFSARSDSPNFNARIGVSIYFTLTKSQQTELTPYLSNDDTRIKIRDLTADRCYDVGSTQNYDGEYFKCTAVLCKTHGRGNWV